MMFTKCGAGANDQITRGSVGVHLTCLLLLLATASRLFLLNAGELNVLRAMWEQRALVPRVGSLWGVGLDGTARTADVANSRCLMFVVRSGQISTDLAYWNDVIGRVSRHQSPIEYWGICDAGTACNGYQSRARFRIVGFLDAYQMRTVVNADDRGDALLYGTRQVLKAHVQRLTNTSAMAEQILRAAR
jgi:hypothetical protein